MARKTIASLEEEIKKLNEMLNSSYKTIEKFMAENSQLRDKADDDFKDSSLYLQMKKKIKNLEMKLKVKDSTINTYKSCEDRLIKQKDEFLDEIEQLKNENDKLKKDNEDLKASLSDVDVQKLILEYRNLIDKKDSNYNSLSDKFQKLINENDKLKKENEKLKANAPEDVGELHIKLDRAIERNKNIIKDYSKCSKENEQLKKHIKELQDKHIGRPKKINDDIIQKIIEFRESKKSIRAISSELGVSIGSVHKIIEQNNL